MYLFILLFLTIIIKFQELIFKTFLRRKCLKLKLFPKTQPKFIHRSYKYLWYKYT